MKGGAHPFIIAFFSFPVSKNVPYLLAGWSGGAILPRRPTNFGLQNGKGLLCFQ